MTRSRRHLDADEQVVVHTRTHAKALIGPAVLLVLLGAAVGAGSAALPPLLPASSRPAMQVVLVLLGLVLAVWWVVRPFLRWAATTYTITDRRLNTRSGILSRTGQDIPLIRVTDVRSERSLSDRVFGCGTLIVQTAAENGSITLDDVPDVVWVQDELTALLFAPHGGWSAPGEPADGGYATTDTRADHRRAWSVDAFDEPVDERRDEGADEESAPRRTFRRARRR